MACYSTDKNGNMHGKPGEKSEKFVKKISSENRFQKKLKEKY